MEIDQRSKDILRKAFEANGWEVKETDTFCNWDLEATKEGITALIEIKDRNVPSTQYSDNTIEEFKRHEMYMRIKDNPFIKALIFTLFPDGVIYANNIRDNHKTIRRLCNATTAFADSRMINKELVSYKPRMVLTYENNKVIWP